MALTDRQKQLIRSSYDHVMPVASSFAEDFYNYLFELAPEARALFKSDITAQGFKLTYTLRALIAGLDRLDEIVPTIQDLGRRHAAYQVTPEQYGLVGKALLCTLERSLKDEFTAEVREAWFTLYNLVAQVAIDAANSVPNATVPNLVQ